MDDFDFSFIGNFLRSYRAAHGESLQSMANRSGVSRSMIAQIESGQTMPTILVLAKLAKAMNIDVATLVQPPEQNLKVEFFEASEENICSKSDSAFVCHLLSTQTGHIETEVYQFYFKHAGKTAFAANSKGSVKHLWLDSGKLSLYVANKKVPIKPQVLTRFNAGTPHRFEAMSNELPKGLFFVVR